MEIIRNGTFITAFLQGLVVVFFVYVLIFTATVIQSRGQPDQYLTLSSASAIIGRNEPVATLSPQQLQPEDHENALAAGGAEGVAHPPLEITAGANQETGSVVVPDLVENTAEGPLPKPSPDGQTPFNAYKRPYTPDGHPVVALAVMNYGLSESDSREALKKLPADVTLILNPYAQAPDSWKSLASVERREFWVFVPVESQTYPLSEDPGPQALLAHSDFKYNQEKFLWALTRTSGYAGIAAFTDAAFLNAQSALKTLWDEGYNRGLGYLEINPAGLEGIEMNAVEKKAPYIRNHSIYDPDSQTPEQWLRALELEAGNNGYAVGIIRAPYPKIVDAIAQWAGSLKERGFSLAPVSALAQVNADAPAP